MDSKTQEFLSGLFNKSTANTNKTSTITLDLFNSLNQKKGENFDSLLIASYSLIVMVSLIGNLMVCTAMCEKRHAMSTTNILILNLAISDLLMTTLNIPFNIFRIVLDNWPFGETLCVLVPFIQSVSVHCSSFTMMFIAIERYRSVINNTHFDRKCWGRFSPYVRILAIIWCLSIGFSIPHGIYNRLVRNTIINIVRCRVIYPEPSHQFRQWSTLFTLMSQYLIPIVITLVCYLRICYFLWRRRIVGTVSECQRVSINRRKMRRIKMLIMVVLVFAVCWLPLNIYHILTDFKFISYTPVLFFSTHWFAMSSVCYNPFIYCWLNEEFQKKVKNIFKCMASGDRNSGQIEEQNTEDIPLGRIENHSNNSP